MDAVRDEKVNNFMSQFRDSTTKELKNLTSKQFLTVWQNYDKDGDGYIEGRELDSFLREFILAIADTSSENISEKTLAEMREHFLETYDDNKDGKIEIRELAQLLPLEESFLLLFRFDNPLDSSIEFMKIWRKYDTDNNGSIDADELKNFLRDILTATKGDISDDRLAEYSCNILRIFDANKDGKLQLSEMAKLLPVKENFLMKYKINTKLTKDDIERVFANYDRDNNGTIENEELNGFLKDLLEIVKKDGIDGIELENFKESILAVCDTNRDGKVDRKELTMVLMALNREPDD